MVADPVHDSVAPVLARTDGDLMMMSTPRGKRGRFYRTWAYGGPEWERVFGPVTASCRIAENYLDRERSERGEEYFAQEYLCEFVDNGSHVFDEEELREVFSQDAQPWEPPRR